MGGIRVLRQLAIISFLLVISAPVWATPEEADTSEERARASFVDQFGKFMQDKNVQGRPKDATGKVVTGGKKTRFNGDDGLAFQSDLTYHDNAFNFFMQEQQQPQQGQGQQNQQQPKEKRIHAFVSPHGAIGAAGGSSLLERTVYQFDQQYAQQDEQNKNQPETPGVKFRSVFKVTTQEVDDKNKDGNEMEKQKVDKYDLRDEVKQAVTKVGETSSETILQSARGEGNENDPQALGNGVLLRAAAEEATKALWNSTMANLSQRRMYRAIRQGAMNFGVQVNEDVPRCDQWANTARGVVNGNANTPPDMKQKQLQEIDRMLGQCKQVAALPYNAINPNFKADDQGQENLAIEGPQKEDSFQRDSRIQLEIMAKAGKSVTEVPSNWQYGKDADKARMTIAYDEGQPKEGTKTIKEQLESYNENLKQAEEGYNEVATRIPGLNVPKPTDYAIQPGTRNIMDINKPPASAFEEVNIQRKGPTGPVPQTYEQLLQNAQIN